MAATGKELKVGLQPLGERVDGRPLDAGGFAATGKELKDSASREASSLTSSGCNWERIERLSPPHSTVFTLF
jgi:hypothetical protein